MIIITLKNANNNNHKIVIMVITKSNSKTSCNIDHQNKVKSIIPKS